MESPPIRRALISVSSKLGLADFARGLAAAGVELFSTGGTRQFLSDEGFVVRDVAEYTGFPAMLDGRVKTLHPRVHGGILARRDRPDDLAALSAHGILTFDLVVVNVYPFEATVARGDATLEEAIEQIDIGGPSLIRAAAKNHAFVTIATDPAQYSAILDEVTRAGETTLDLRRRLAQAAFARTAAYDQEIAAYLERKLAPDIFPPTLSLSVRRKAELRYGENPHQRAALYVDSQGVDPQGVDPQGVDPQGTDPRGAGPSLVAAQQLIGKELSYNNLLDLDSALAIVRPFAEPACAVIKHNNPCGAAVAETLAAATHSALEGDPVSAFGGVLAFNRRVDAATAEVLAEPGRFVEAIAAPDFEPAALEILTTRPKWKANVRLMKVGRLDGSPAATEWRRLAGGWLVQDADTAPDDESQWQVVTTSKPAAELMPSIRFAWSLVKRVKSNAIVLAAGRALCGVGAGQMSRVDSVEIAIKKAGERARGAALASDAFFPFPDSIAAAADAGVAAIIQPGGSRRDDDVIAACNERGLSMIFTGRRHFRH